MPHGNDGLDESLMMTILNLSNPLELLLGVVDRQLGYCVESTMI